MRNQYPKIPDSGRTTPDEFRLAWYAVRHDSFWQGERWLKRKGGSIYPARLAMAHSLALSVVAEGVETASQRDYLGGLGCDIVQGHLFSRPLPAADMGTLFRSG